jgi:hypothetical protein
MFWIFFNARKKNSTNDNDSYWLECLIYLSMIDEHIILINFGFNSFNETCDFNTKPRFSILFYF